MGYCLSDLRDTQSGHKVNGSDCAVSVETNSNICDWQDLKTNFPTSEETRTYHATTTPTFFSTEAFTEILNCLWENVDKTTEQYRTDPQPRKRANMCRMPYQQKLLIYMHVSHSLFPLRSSSFILTERSNKPRVSAPTAKHAQL